MKINREIEILIEEARKTLRGLGLSEDLIEDGYDTGTLTPRGKRAAAMLPVMLASHVNMEAAGIMSQAESLTMFRESFRDLLAA